MLPIFFAHAFSHKLVGTLCMLFICVVTCDDCARVDSLNLNKFKVHVEYRHFTSPYQFPFMTTITTLAVTTINTTHRMHHRTAVARWVDGKLLDSGIYGVTGISCSSAHTIGTYDPKLACQPCLPAPREQPEPEVVLSMHWEHSTLLPAHP